MRVVHHELQEPRCHRSFPAHSSLLLTGAMASQYMRLEGFKLVKWLLDVNITNDSYPPHRFSFSVQFPKRYHPFPPTSPTPLLQSIPIGYFPRISPQKTDRLRMRLLLSIHGPITLSTSVPSCPGRGSRGHIIDTSWIMPNPQSFEY